MTAVAKPRITLCPTCEGEGVVVRMPDDLPRSRFDYSRWRGEVTEADIDGAQKRGGVIRSRERIRWNIAFGKFLGTYRH